MVFVSQWIIKVRLVDDSLSRGNPLFGIEDSPDYGICVFVVGFAPTSVFTQSANSDAASVELFKDLSFSVLSPVETNICRVEFQIMLQGNSVNAIFYCGERRDRAAGAVDRHVFVGWQ